MRIQDVDGKWTEICVGAAICGIRLRAVQIGVIDMLHPDFHGYMDDVIYTRFAPETLSPDKIGKNTGIYKE